MANLERLGNKNGILRTTTNKCGTITDHTNNEQKNKRLRVISHNAIPKQRTWGKHKTTLLSHTTEYYLMLYIGIFNNWSKEESFTSPIVSTTSKNVVMKGVTSSLYIGMC